jgi:NitT/TauT family transport system ATP-binding protein
MKMTIASAPQAPRPGRDVSHVAAALPAAEIVVDRVSKSYGSAKFAKAVVRDCSFVLDRGKLTVMIGPSGCGKSTLIRLLAGFERPTAGTITIGGRPVLGPGLDRLVLFQESALFPWMTTFGNIMFGPRARAAAGRDAVSQAEFLLNKVGLAAFRRNIPRSSRGACSGAPSLRGP